AEKRRAPHPPALADQQLAAGRSPHRVRQSRIKIATSSGRGDWLLPQRLAGLRAADLNIAFPRIRTAPHLEHEIAGARRLGFPQQAQTRLTGQAAPLAMIA